jgi:hypothetical protein
VLENNLFKLEITAVASRIFNMSKSSSMLSQPTTTAAAAPSTATDYYTGHNMGNLTNRS